MEKYTKVSSMKKKMIVVLLAMCMILISGCGKVLLTTGPKEDEVFLINNEPCRLPELMVYLVTVQNLYENVYGEEIWNTGYDGVTLEENVRETVLARIAQTKTMYLLAKEKGVELTQEEQEKVKAAAEEYFSSLNERETEVMGVDAETVQKLYTEYALANKVYQVIIQDVNPEISDDEARTVTVQDILIRNYYMDGEERKPYSRTDGEEARERAEFVYAMAVDGTHDFEDLAVRYSENEVITYSFRKGQADPAIENAAFRLETNAISDIVVTDEGYHIIKCINTFNREETDANKVIILEERRREAFAREYDAFVAALAKQLNETLWEKVELVRDDRVTTDDFFEIYAKYF